MACRQLDPVRAVVIVDHQFAAIVFFRFRKKQRDRKISADAEARQVVTPDAVIDVLAKELPWDVSVEVSVEERWEDVQRYRRRNEQGIGGERTENALAELPGRLAVGWQLLVFLHLRRLRPKWIVRPPTLGCP